MSLKINAKIKDGRFPKNVVNLIREYMDSNCNKDISLEMKRQSKVSSNQYGYLFAAVYPTISHELFRLHGEKLDVYDVDIMMKLKFWNTKSIDFDTGEVITLPNSKTKMNKQEMMLFIDNVINWCNERDIFISEPYSPNIEYDFAVLESDINS